MHLPKLQNLTLGYMGVLKDSAKWSSIINHPNSLELSLDKLACASCTAEALISLNSSIRLKDFETFFLHEPQVFLQGKQLPSINS